MKLVILSTGWNIEKYVSQYIDSIKSQTYKDFVVYLIDDVSTDNTFEVAQKQIGDDSRFILIKNTEKKWKTKNFIDVINNNSLIIKQEDVLVEIDADDKLFDEHVLMKIYNIYLTNPNIWVCGSKWKDTLERPGKYGKIVPERARTGYTIFSHMRTFKAFLFRAIREEDLIFNGEYFKAACDIAHGIPILEMAGSDHYYYFDEVTYIYRWHNSQSYSENGSHKDPTLQRKSSGYVLKLPKYKQLVIGPDTDINTLKGEVIEKKV